jgi:hypothetical protein
MSVLAALRHALQSTEVHATRGELPQQAVGQDGRGPSLATCMSVLAALRHA